MSGLSGRQPKAVQSALEILEQVALIGPGVTAKEIAEVLGLPPATAYRLLNLLVGEEYLVRLHDLSGFALGARTAGLVRAASAPLVPAAARRLLADLRSHVRFGVHLVVYVGASPRLVDVDPDHPAADQHLMARHPDASAPGRLLLAERDATLADPRRDGVTREHGEFDPDRAALAVPVRAADGTLVAALLVTARLSRADALDEHLDRLRACALGLGPLLA